MKLWTLEYEDVDGIDDRAWFATKAAALSERKLKLAVCTYVGAPQAVVVPTDREGLATFLNDMSC